MKILSNLKTFASKPITIGNTQEEQKSQHVTACWLVSGREDLNLRLPAPEAGALTGLRYAPFC